MESAMDWKIKEALPVYGEPDTCNAPSWIWKPFGNGHKKVRIPCKECWRCRANRINEYEGRCLAEASMCKRAVALTLTYGPDAPDGGHDLIKPQHFQKFIRALRIRDHLVRYLACGEYGKKKGRAHFHCILFFETTPPAWAHQKNIHIPEWPHGYVWADWNIEPRSVRYVLKYIMKEQDTSDPRKSWFTCSKYPPLGDAFFRKLASEMVEAGVMPQTYLYAAPAGFAKRDYIMTRATRRNFMTYLLAGYAEKGRKVPKWSMSEAVQEWIADHEASEKQAAFWALPPDEIAEIFREEFSRKAPSENTVRKDLYDTDKIHFDNEPPTVRETDILMKSARERWQNGSSFKQPSEGPSRHLARRTQRSERFKRGNTS
jgi:hypothetical protein